MQNVRVPTLPVRFNRVPFLAFLSLIATSPGIAAGEWFSEWRSLVVTGTELGTRGHFAEAEAALKRAWELADKCADPERLGPIAVTAVNLAALYNDAARYRDAERVLREAVRRVQERSAADEEVEALLLATMTQVYVEAGQVAKAEREYGRLAAIPVSALNSSATRMSVLSARGRVLHATGRYVEAEAQFWKALQEAETGGGGPLDVATALTNLGFVEFDRISFLSASLHLDRALKIYERTVGHSSPRLLAPLVQLAWIAKADGRPSDALNAMERAARIAELAYGGTGRNFWRVLRLYAGLLRDAGEKKRAAEVEARMRTIAITPEPQNHTVDVGELGKRP